MKALASDIIRCSDGQAEIAVISLLSTSDADYTPFQRKKYYNGLGSENNIAWLKRLETGVFGSGFSDQIREVYKVRLRSPTETP